MARKISKANSILHLFSGEDREIIRAIDDGKINRNFNEIGLAVIIICILCFFSALLFSFNILEGVGKIASIPIGVFWGLAITIIYVLLLYTISPPLLVDKKMLSKKAAGKHKQKLINKDSLAQENFQKWLTVSMVFRIVFIMVFALIVAQPINVLLFSNSVKGELALFRSHYKSKMILQKNEQSVEDEVRLYQDFRSRYHTIYIPPEKRTTVDKLIKGIETKIYSDRNSFKIAEGIQAKIQKNTDNFKEDENVPLIHQLENVVLNELNSDARILENSYSESLSEVHEVDKYKQEFIALLHDKVKSDNGIISLIDDTSFYIRRIIIINNANILAIITNLAFIALFIGPIFLKFQIRKIKPKHSKSFYNYKQRLEAEIVKKTYSQFKHRFDEYFSNMQLMAFHKVSVNFEPLLIELGKYKPDCAERIRKDNILRYYPYVDIPEKKLISDFGFTHEELSKLDKRNRIVIYEKYTDPPFNLKLKETKIEELSGSKIINSVWGDE